MIRTFWGVLLLLSVMALPGSLPAMADASWKTSSAIWKGMDNCTKAARKAFPDYTKEFECQARGRAAELPALRQSARGRRRVSARAAGQRGGAPAIGQPWAFLWPAATFAGCRR